MKKTFIFPGQGSQKKGMGKGLFEAFPELTKKADKILGYSIAELCLNDPDKKLNQTQYTQPALYVVNALSYQKKLKEGGKQADYLAGHSLGEFNALQASGVLSFESGLKLVKKRGELMGKVKNGGMAAILNSSQKQIETILTQAKLTTIDIANFNSNSQIVISGLEEDINNAQPYFEKADVMFIPINTSGAFHSRYMKDAADKFEKLVKKTKFSKLQIPVISNVTAKPYDYKNIAKHLTQQLYNSVRWSESMTYLLDQGVTEFEELGVGEVLTKLTGYIKNDYDKRKKAQEDLAKEKDTAVVEKAASKVKKESKQEAEKQIANEKIDPLALVENWNQAHPIGTKVTSDLYDNELETRTSAMVLFGHRAAVYMKGYNGYFDLSEVKVVKG